MSFSKVIFYSFTNWYLKTGGRIQRSPLQKCFIRPRFLSLQKWYYLLLVCNCISNSIRFFDRFHYIIYSFIIPNNLSFFLCFFTSVFKNVNCYILTDKNVVFKIISIEPNKQKNMPSVYVFFELGGPLINRF